MRLVGLVGLVGLGACYAPSFPTGAPCDELHPCPSALVCTKTGTCETGESNEMETDASVVPDATIDACVPTSEICDDGIDQDCVDGDRTCATNDLAASPVDVTNGGTFSGDFSIANDDYVERGCGNVGGRELFYRVTLTSPQVYYIDTFGSDFDTSVRVFAGKTCDALGATTDPTTCDDDACGTMQSQFAFSLPSGTSCIVVDQGAAAATSSSLTMRVTRGGRTGSPLGDDTQTLTGDTCTATHVWNPNIPCNDSDNNAKDLAWYFTSCPGVNRKLDASTCVDVTMVHFDTVLYVHKAGTQADLVCDDDTSGCPARPDRPDHADGTVLTDVNTTGPGLFWLILDAYGSTACGGYRLDTNLD